MMLNSMMRRAPWNVVSLSGIVGAVFFGLVFSGPAHSNQVQLAIRGVAVVAVGTGQIIPDQTILIDENRIVTIGSAADIEIPSSARVIAGQGLFAVPGLVDLHVHMETDDLPLFLANGITTVREMNGSTETLELRTQVEDGARRGPRIYVAGPLLAGVEQQWRHRLVGDPDQAREEVLLQKAAGFDFVKVYDGLSTDTYQAIVATASELGLPIVGHIPSEVGLRGVVEHDQLSIEHVEQIMNVTVGHMPDRSRIADIVQTIRGGSTAVTPTLAAMEILGSPRSAWFDGLFSRPEMAYAPTAMLNWWESLRQAPEARVTLRDTVTGGTGSRIEFLRELTRELADAGVPILVGTDTPNPLLVPGFSLHHELEALVRAGLDPRRVLRAATRDAAIHLGAEDVFGTIQTGLQADIVLVGGNPFASLSHLRDVRGLVLRGEWFARDRLQNALDEVAELPTRGRSR